MPFDATGAYVADLQPPTPEQLGVAPATPPVVAVDDTRPIVVSPTQGIPEFAGGGMAPPPPVLPPPVVAPPPVIAPPPPVAAAPQPPAPVVHHAPAHAAPVAPQPTPGEPIAVAADKLTAAGDKAAASTDISLAEQATQKQNVADAQAVNAQREVDRQAKDAADRASFQKQIDTVQKSYANDKYEGLKLSPGREVLASLGLLLGGVSYDPHHVNQSVGIYENAVKDDFARWQANHETLYKNLQETLNQGKQLSADQLSRASEARIADAAKLQAVIDQADAWSAKSKNAAAVDAVKQANAKLELASSQATDEAYRLHAAAEETKRHNRAEEGIARERLGIEREKAAKGAKEADIQKEISPIAKEFDKDEARLNGTAKSPGLIAKQQAIRELGDNLRKAAASGDPQAVISAIIAGRESISKLNTGAVPNHTVLALQASLQGDPSVVQERLSKLFGNPKASQQAVKGLATELDQADESVLQQIDKEHARLNAKYNAPNIGIAKTEAQRNHVAGRIGGVFGGVTTRTPQGDVPRYSESGAPAAPAAPQTRVVVPTKGQYAGKHVTIDAQNNILQVQ